MDRIIVELTSKRALNLLKDLEELHVLKIVGPSASPFNETLSDKFAGKLPPEVAEEMQKYIVQSRNEWDRI